MIKKFIDKLLGKDPAKSTAAKAKKPDFGKREEVSQAGARHRPQAGGRARAQRGAAPCKQAGFEAYVVGGAVRDLLLGLRPKDFDVATNATPEQVKGLFRRAFIIGRRFRIVHVVYGRGREHEVIEVSTFRAYLDNAAAEQVAGNEKTSKSELAGMKHAVDSTGRVLRDNVWGPQEEDAARRDFTINAMYYDPRQPDRGRLPRRHQGRQEADAAHDRRPGHALPRGPGAHHPRRALRGQAQRRWASSSIPRRRAAGQVQALLADVPQSRLFDEMLKLLQTGHALATHRATQAAGHGARHLPAARRGGGARGPDLS